MIMDPKRILFVLAIYVCMIGLGTAAVTPDSTLSTSSTEGTPENNPESETESELEPSNTTTTTEGITEGDSESQTETESESESSNTTTTTEGSPEGDSESETEAESESEPTNTTTPGSKSEAESETEQATNTTESIPENDPESETNSESEPTNATYSTPEDEPESETDTESEPLKEPDDDYFPGLANINSEWWFGTQAPEPEKVQPDDPAADPEQENEELTKDENNDGDDKDNVATLKIMVVILGTLCLFLTLLLLCIIYKSKRQSTLEMMVTRDPKKVHDIVPDRVSYAFKDGPPPCYTISANETQSSPVNTNTLLVEKLTGSQLLVISPEPSEVIGEELAPSTAPGDSSLSRNDIETLAVQFPISGLDSKTAIKDQNTPSETDNSISVESPTENDDVTVSLSEI